MSEDRLAVIGTGRIGLCLALNLERCGYEVLGVDKDPDRVRRIRRRMLNTPEPGVEEALIAADALRMADSIAAVPEFNPTLVFIAVDTPTTVEGGYDPHHVDSVMRELFALPAPFERTEIVLVSTILPGYCDAKGAAAEASGYALSYSPGFVAHGRIMHDQQRPVQVLIGEADASAGDRIARVYRTMCLNEPSFHRMSRLSAEIAKLATNCFLTMKIAFANAIGDLAMRVSAEPEHVLGAIGADARVGAALLRYGFGYGGPCLPRDNRALNLFARQHGCELLQADATDETNRRHLAFQLEECLRTHPETEPIHFHSVTYKPGTEILEESQPLALAVQLARIGRRVVIHESAAVVAQLRARFGELFEYCVERGVCA